MNFLPLGLCLRYNLQRLPLGWCNWLSGKNTGDGAAPGSMSAIKRLPVQGFMEEIHPAIAASGKYAGWRAPFAYSCDARDRPATLTAPTKGCSRKLFEAGIRHVLRWGKDLFSAADPGACQKQQHCMGQPGQWKPSLIALERLKRLTRRQAMPWRVRVSVSRRRLPPAGFIVPCRPTLVAQPPSGPIWSHEVKYDGYRILARAGEGRVRLWSRNALDWTARLPRIEQAVAGLDVRSIVLDGEAIAEDDIGRPDFYGLQSIAGLESAIYVVWDVLELDGLDLRQMPLQGRREVLVRLMADAPDGLVLAETFDDGPGLFRIACAMGLEGVVSKRLDSPYRSGRALTWLKTKCEGYVR